MLQLADRNFIISKGVFMSSSSLKALLNPTPSAGFSNTKKPLTAKALALMLNKLNKLGENGAEEIAILEESIA